MNVYDFDKTIYFDDCATDFYLYSLKKKPTLAKLWRKLGWDYVKFRMNKITRSELKESLYQYVKYIDNLEEEVRAFWATHEHKIQEWYLSQKRDDDLIISASPEFLIFPIAKQLGVAAIASRLNPETGYYDGVNCYGSEKVNRFYEIYPDGKINEFYSDHPSDTPLAQLADKAFMVTDGVLSPWPQDLLEKRKEYV